MYISLVAALALAGSAATVSASPINSPSLAKRYDDRSLIGFPSQNGTEFCAKWVSDCQSYQATNKDLRFISTHCTPGDYQGKDTDTRALAWCMYGTYTSVLHHIESETGSWSV